MRPVKTNETNFVYLGPTDDIADLPCRVDGSETFCVWSFSDDERKQIADGASIRLGIHGMRPIPPVSLQVVPNVGPTERVDGPCSECGKEIEDVSHDSGLGTHAFRARPKEPQSEYRPHKFG